MQPIQIFFQGKEPKIEKPDVQKRRSRPSCNERFINFVRYIFGKMPEIHISKTDAFQSCSKQIPVERSEEKKRGIVQSAALSKVGSSAKAGLINVPDDGNCLFYSIAVGLRSQFPMDSDIQEKLNWEVSPEKLKSNLYQEKQLLARPGKILRDQAAIWLKHHQNEESIMIAIMSSIGTHNNVTKERIENDQTLMPILEEDLAYLDKRSPKSADDHVQITQKKEQMAAMEKVMEMQKKHIIEENAIGKYLEFCGQEHFYCGTPEVMALSTIYGIPITVDYGYTVETYNPSLSEKLPLKIKYINGNHFNYMQPKS